MSSTPTTLLLDIDLTCLIAVRNAAYETYGRDKTRIKTEFDIDAIHYLADPIPYYDYQIFVINPVDLNRLITNCYKEDAEIVIFTSGTWDKTLLPIISAGCTLCPSIAARFEDAPFYNATTDSALLGLPQAATAVLGKAYRLHGLFKPVKSLRERKFVLLDDNPRHILSCNSLGYIEGVLATIKTASKDYYAQVIGSIKRAPVDLATSPATSHYFFPEKVLSHYMAIILGRPTPVDEPAAAESKEDRADTISKLEEALSDLESSISEKDDLSLAASAITL